MNYSSCPSVEVENLITNWNEMKRLLQVFLGKSHPYYHAVVLAVALYAAWKVRKIDQQLQDGVELKGHIEKRY